jgi:hypothetical protein
MLWHKCIVAGTDVRQEHLMLHSACCAARRLQFGATAGTSVLRSFSWLAMGGFRAAAT